MRSSAPELYTLPWEIVRTDGSDTFLADHPSVMVRHAVPGLPTRALGKTGQQVSILALGGWHIGSVRDDKEAIRIMHAAIDEGLTFFDNAWDYHDGYSEELMGKAIQDRRDRVFLMTKNCERDYEGSKKCLDDSLRRLRTDYIDLWQFHEMVYDSDPDWVFDKGGIRAAREAAGGAVGGAAAPSGRGANA